MEASYLILESDAFTHELSEQKSPGGMWTLSGECFLGAGCAEGGFAAA